MNREELLMHHAEVCARALEIMQVKNHDYAGKNGEEPVSYTHLTLPTNREV